VVGNAALLDEQKIAHPTAEADSSTMFVAADGQFLGAIRLADVVRPHAKESLDLLRQHGVKRLVMLTGDNASVAASIARDLGIDEVFADLLPEQKVGVIERLRSEGHRVAMVGDGINDAPALAVADVGIAMGVAGTQAAIEAADIALMTDDLGKILQARAIAERAYRTIKENLIFGVGVVHVAGIVAALLKLIGPVQAALIHLGPDILVFLNSVKLLRVRIPNVDASGDARQ
jgi:P-type E1-E2 ATPase